MKIHSILSFLLVLCVFLSCSSNDTVTPTSYPFALPPAGVYNYSGFDSLGIHIVQGTISFYYADSIRMRGTWNLAAVGNLGAIRPQIGNDTLWGRYTKSQFTLVLNPQVVDNNVSISLYSKIDPQTFIGKWVWITERGYTNYGQSQFVIDSIY